MRAVPPNESVVLVAIGQYIGEGFNFPRLDTMMLTMPISWQGNVSNMRVVYTAITRVSEMLSSMTM